MDGDKVSGVGLEGDNNLDWVLLMPIIEREIRGILKALVWFWWIDETLSANLVYQSDYEIGSTTPSGEANEDHDLMNGDAMVMIKVLGLGKKAREIQKAQGKGEIDRNFLV